MSWAAARQSAEHPWQCSDRERALASPAWCLARKARSPSQPRAVTRPWPPRPVARRRSSTTYVEQFGHVSAERVVSGAGLENLYRAVVALDGVDAPQRDAAEITTAALKAGCPIAKAALELFCAMLGTIAGNIALTFGARGGVYIAGGIAPRIADFMSGSDFRVRFEHKGRFRNYVEAIPSSVILHPAVTFVGLSAIANRVPGATSESHRSRDEETPRGD